MKMMSILELCVKKAGNLKNNTCENERKKKPSHAVRWYLTSHLYIKKFTIQCMLVIMSAQL